MSQTECALTETTTPTAELEVGVTNCSNCGTALTGKFCHKCGQSSRSMIKFFGEVIRELLDDILGYDSRLKHSILPLLLQPGKLTLEYIKGRRFFYVMPFRLYLITSLLFIFALEFVVDPSEMVLSDKNKSEIVADVKEGLKDSDLTPEEQQQIIERMEGPIISLNFGDETTPKEPLNENAISNTSKTNITEKPQAEQSFGVTLDEDGAHFRGYQVKEEGLFKDVMDEINSKGEGWLKDPKPLIDEFFQIFPYMMFILLPIFAIFQKLLYLFSKRFYIEHLVFSLHNHCFINTALLLSMALELTSNKLLQIENSIAQASHSVIEFVSMLLGFWIITYIILATKRVYQQGWWLTLGKVFSLGFIYSLLSIIGLLVTIVIGAYRA